ncbi:MAG: hypothetical protein ACEPOW_11715 [Bacteroidales bacterium]
MSKKNILFSILTLALWIVSTCPTRAEMDPASRKRIKKVDNLKSTAAGCVESKGFEWLSVNNVRCRVNVGGDMFYGHDGLPSSYFIPANGTATSLYCSSLWIGGLDINKQLKLAAHRFRGKGVDFWPGPLTTDKTASIDPENCVKYDRFFKMSRKMVQEYIAHTDPVSGEFVPAEGYKIPDEILNWPGNGVEGDKLQQSYLAPYVDYNKNGVYEPTKGDYPYYDMDNELCGSNTPIPESDVQIYSENDPRHITGGRLVDQVIKGDETLWWVFNDKGNVHTETQGEAIGLEIRAQAFAFSTSDEINNMTFYSYEIVNRSTYTLTETFFSPWLDTDLGYSYDDYVGCDVGRGLGYCYNGKDVDGSGTSEAYGAQPPAVGVDFFQGPYLDADGKDNPDVKKLKGVKPDASINGVNFDDGIIDNERFGMRRFIYHNNGGGSEPNIDPQTAPDYYNYLRGIWRDNSRMQYGGNGHPSGGAVGPDADFMFPGDSDPWNWGTGGTPPEDGYNKNGKYWTEQGEGNAPGDRRFMQSAGPFTLEPGAVNYITYGIPWARAASGGAWASVEKLRKVDDKCQKLFENCFKLIDGPNAPDLIFRETENKLICFITNPDGSNNEGESYDEYDPNISIPEINHPKLKRDTTYTFEGYMIYQLVDETVSPDEFSDNSRARLIAQFDVKNGLTTLVNVVQDDDSGYDFPVVKVKGKDNGIQHSFEITEDLFAEKDKQLVNHKTYYYSAVAYAANQYLPYSSDPSSGLIEGQKKPYLSGRNGIATYSAIPHTEVNGVIPNVKFGDGIELVRLQGTGNGGIDLEFAKGEEERLLAKEIASDENTFGNKNYPILYHPKYKAGNGPLNLKVIDPVKIKKGKYEVRFTSRKNVVQEDKSELPTAVDDEYEMNSARWSLFEILTNESGDVIGEKEYKADTTIDYLYDQAYIDLGFSIALEQSYFPGPVRVGTIYGGQTPEANYEILSTNNGLIFSTEVYDDENNIWMTGVMDYDGLPKSCFNWIRSGNYNPTVGDDKSLMQDTRVSSSATSNADPNGVYEKIAMGTWSPYNLIASHDEGAYLYSPLPYKQSKKDEKKMNRLGSVDIVFTADKSKWTRCPVFEMCPDSKISQNNGEKFQLRKSPSIDKDGNFAKADAKPSNDPNSAAYISAKGMGWFPGYAINLETGARLNITYTENSYLTQLNGADMKFNPAERDVNLPQVFDPAVVDPLNMTPRFGGMHYVMVWSTGETEEG